MTSSQVAPAEGSSNASESSSLKEASKGTNGETGVAGNVSTRSLTNDVEKRGGFVKTREKMVKAKDKDKHVPVNKASRRTTSLLNLFMSNSQGRLLV